MNATATTDTARTTERDTTRARILDVAAWLTSGLLRPEAVVAAMQQWQVSRRTAQVYVHKAANRIARMTEFDDPLFAMKLSQLQRDKLYQQLQTLQTESVQMEPHEVRSLLQTIQTQLKLLDSRDRTAAKIAQLEAKFGRPEVRQRSAQKACMEEQTAATPVPATGPSQEGQPARTARPEVMRAAAQVTQESPPVAVSKPKGHKKMQSAATTRRSPAPDGQNCALETSAVVIEPAGAVADAA